MFERLVEAYVLAPNPVVKATFNRIQNERVLNTQSLKHLCHFNDDHIGILVPSQSIELFLLESSIWTGLYKRDFLEENRIRFYESPGASYQDMPFKFICYSIIDEITLLNIPVYNYRVLNEGSSSASSDKALISFNNYDIIKNFLVNTGRFSTFLQVFYFHHMFDLVFHASRLEGEGLEQYLIKARSVFKEAKTEGFDLEKTSFSPDTNDYYYNHVLPLYKSIIAEKEIITNKQSRKLRRKLINKARFISNKLIVDPIVAIVTASINNALSKMLTYLDSRIDKVEAHLNYYINSSEDLSQFVTLVVAPTNQFHYYIRANEERIIRLREEFRRGLDEFSILNEKKLFGFYEILPYYEHQGLKIKLPISTTLLTDEDRFILSNINVIMSKLKQDWSHLDLTELPITLATNYFKSGIKYLPDSISEQFVGKLAIDCGAWVGDTSIMFASFGFDKVVAMEPMLDNYKCLERNIERNTQYLGDVIEPMNIAVGDTVESLSMVKVGDDGVGSCVVESEVSDKISVNSVTIDFLVESDYDDYDVGLIKFDVEGYELKALKGAESTIRKTKPVLLISVYHLWLQPEQIFDCKRFVEELNLGYKFKLVHLQPEKDLVYEYMLICW
jgi:FkbM family methyltransferase